MFIFFASITIILGLIYGHQQKQSNEILSEIREFKREMQSYNRGIEMNFRSIEGRIKELQKMVGEDW